jgi:murein DD-endopeptidase MepM/ murein hydrolase activator NlpD
MAAYKTSGLDFSSVQQEITYWIAHTSSTFKGGFSGSGENGNDFAMPMGTPVYAVQGGTVVGQGYYGGGGVVSIQSNPTRIWYYQHLDQDEAVTGQQVQKGQLIGYSGGQNAGGNHPSTTEFSGYPHIEVGINAPWGGIWGNNANLPNIDPRPTLLSLVGDVTSTNANGLGAATGTAPTGTGSFNPLDPSTWLSGLESGVFSSLGVSSLQDFFWRTGFIVLGLILIIVGFVVTFQRQAEEGVGTVIGAAAKAG